MTYYTHAPDTITREMIKALAGHPDGLTTTELAKIWQRRIPGVERYEATRRVALAMRIHAGKGNVVKVGTTTAEQGHRGHATSIWKITQQGRDQYLIRHCYACGQELPDE